MSIATIADRKEQLAMVQSIALPDETIEAVYDLKGSGTGFIGITTKRLVIYDKAFLRRLKAVVSIPYNRIYSVASQDESGLLSGRGFFGTSLLIITTAEGDKEFEFRSNDKAHDAHKRIVGHMVG